MTKPRFSVSHVSHFAGRVPTWRLAGYAAPAAALAMLALPLQVFVPTLYAQEIGISLTTIGTVLLIARLWDMFTDPVIGILSDRLPTPFGRRRTWMVAGLPLLLVSAWMLFLPPDNAGFWHLLLSLIGVYTFGTMLVVPMNAWGAELTDDVHERTRVQAFRIGTGLIGVVIALVTPALLGYGTDEVRKSSALIGTMGVIALPFLLLAAISSAPDPAHHRNLRKDRFFVVPIVKDLWANRPLRTLYGSFLLNNIATGLPAGLFLLYAKHKIEAPESAGLWLVLFFGSTIASLPLWPWLSRRVGKRNAWVAGMIGACALFVWSPFLGAGDDMIYTIIVIATGICSGANLTLPASMLADIVEQDRGGSGPSRAGILFSVWGSIAKLSAALAAGVSFLVLGWVGFDAQGENGRLGLFALAALYGLVPVILNLAAAMVMMRYSLETGSPPVAARPAQA